MKLLSVHEHVANFQVTDWPHLFFIGDPQLARGPASIGLTTEDFKQFTRLLKLSNGGRVDYGRVVFDIDGGTITIDRRGGEEKSFAPGFYTLKNMVQISLVLPHYSAIIKDLKITSPSAVLFDRPGGDDYHRQAIADHFPAIIKALIDQDKQELIKYCRNICGMGHGLTPTGDDLIHAAFLVANLFGQKGKLFMDSILPEVETFSAQTGMFGRHMIEIGRQGLTPEPFLEYLGALGRGVKAPEIIKSMIRIGSATGFDLAIGLTVTIKEFLESTLMLDK